MSKKQEKEIRAQVGVILVSWLKGLVNEEEAKKINIHNYKSMLPDQSHVYLNGSFKLSAFHPKWVSNRIKKILKNNPSKSISDITLEDIKNVT